MAMQDVPRLTGLSPVIAPGATLLLLGSMPSAASLQKSEYYGHPRNHFWPILGGLLGFDPALPYPQRLRAATQQGIAIWDIVQSCVRPGSLDQDIRDAIPNDIPGLLERFPTISLIGFNGGKAAQLCRRFFGAAVALPCVQLPSSSPIPTRACPTLADKRAAWEAVLTKTWEPPEGWRR